MRLFTLTVLLAGLAFGGLYAAIASAADASKPPAEAAATAPEEFKQPPLPVQAQVTQTTVVAGRALNTPQASVRCRCAMPRAKRVAKWSTLPTRWPAAT